MGQDLEAMPLFPLHAVLFPYASMRLHVFEERYRHLVRKCVQEERAFGVVLIRTGEETGPGHAEPYLVGTAVRILQVETYQDGRMDAHVMGERRFRIRNLDESNPFLVGFVEPVMEESMKSCPKTEGMVEAAREEFEELVQCLFSQQDLSVQVVYPPDPIALSFTIANLLPIDNLVKQRMLETTDTVVRIEELLPILRAQLAAVQSRSYFKIASSDLEEFRSSN